MRRITFLIIGFGYLRLAAAYDVSWPGPNDFPFLPPYCKAKSSMNYPGKEGELALWYSRLGKGFDHAHHYCAGLNFLRRAGQPQKEKSDRPNLLHQSIIEFSYMVSHAEPAGFPLMPEVYVNRGKAYSGLNKTGEAIRDFSRAIELRPDWPGGYLALADLYESKGMHEDVRKTLTEGIEKSSDATALKSRLASLDKKR